MTSSTSWGSRPDLLAKASINNVSRRHIVGTIELWIDGQPDKLVAVAQGTYARP